MVVCKPQASLIFFFCLACEEKKKKKTSLYLNFTIVRKLAMRLRKSNHQNNEIVFYY